MSEIQKKWIGTKKELAKQIKRANRYQEERDRLLEQQRVDREKLKRKNAKISQLREILASPDEEIEELKERVEELEDEASECSGETLDSAETRSIESTPIDSQDHKYLMQISATK